MVIASTGMFSVIVSVNPPTLTWRQVRIHSYLVLIGMVPWLFCLNRKSTSTLLTLEKTFVVTDPPFLSIPLLILLSVMKQRVYVEAFIDCLSKRLTFLLHPLAQCSTTSRFSFSVTLQNGHTVSWTEVQRISGPEWSPYPCRHPSHTPLPT